MQIQLDRHISFLHYRGVGIKAIAYRGGDDDAHDDGDQEEERAKAKSESGSDAASTGLRPAAAGEESQRDRGRYGYGASVWCVPNFQGARHKTRQARPGVGFGGFLFGFS